MTIRESRDDEEVEWFAIVVSMVIGFVLGWLMPR